MVMEFRPTRLADIGETYGIRASTRQNPIPETELISAGFTPQAVAGRYASGEYVGWVCETEKRLVGFAAGNTLTGEIIVIAVLPEYEGKRVGKTLLTLLVESLVAKGCARLWLEASPDPEIRAHGFYRANGWVPSGIKAGNGDEVLELFFPDIDSHP